MTIHSEAIAAMAIALLSPYLTKVGETFAGKVGEAIYKKAQQVHGAIKKHFQGDQTAESILSCFEKHPNEEKWQDALLGVLITRMEDDPQFTMQIKDLLEELRQESGIENTIQQINISGHAGDIFQVKYLKGDIFKKGEQKE